MENKNELTQEQLKAKLHYDTETGLFTHLTSKGVKKGSVAGRVNTKGYVTIGVNGKEYLAHRLAFLYVNGEWPTEQVDHKDQNKSNNTWKNLVEKTNQQNHMNKPRTKSPSECGLSIRKTKYDTYEVAIRHLGAKYGKSFRSHIDALDWSISKYQELGYTFNHYKANVYLLYKIECELLKEAA